MSLAEGIHRMYHYHHKNQPSHFFHHSPGSDSSSSCSSSSSSSSSLVIRSRHIAKHGSQSTVNGAVNVSQSLLPRRWSSLVPGFLKLDMVRCDMPIDNPNAATSPERDDNSGNGKSGHRGASAGASSSVDVNSSISKGTFWENAPIALPLHVNALITAQVRLLIGMVTIIWLQYSHLLVVAWLSDTNVVLVEILKL